MSGFWIFASCRNMTQNQRILPDRGCFLLRCSQPCNDSTPLFSSLIYFWNLVYFREHSILSLFFCLCHDYAVVSVIVTVLTYTFFRSQEQVELQNSFYETAIHLASDSARSLDRKASSARALSKTFWDVTFSSQFLQFRDGNAMV